MQNASLTFSASLPGALVTAVNSPATRPVCQKGHLGECRAHFCDLAQFALLQPYVFFYVFLILSSGTEKERDKLITSLNFPSCQSIDRIPLI